MKSLYLLPLLLLIVSSVRVLPSNDQVSSLPDWPAFSAKGIVMYSGYVNTTLNSTSQISNALHYTFLESLGDPTKDPVILWLNGGPGCSSLFGLFQEIGPYIYNGTTWNFNNFTWLQNASILILESPLGVGFSYNLNDINHSDTETVVENYNALLNWFSSFPDFKSRPFWITGESYAGMYIPFLSSMILNHTKDNGINFKGIMIGNGVLITDNVFNNNTLLSYLSNHNLFSPQILQALQGVCPNDPESVSCQFALQQVNKILQKVNPYDIYGYCSYAQTGSKPFPYYVNFMSNLEESASTSTETNILPCVSSAALQTYLNRADVQTALHIIASTSLAPKNWQDCSNSVFYNYTRYPQGSIVFYPQLIAANLSILLYSGDQDSVVSYLNTQVALNQLNLNVVNPWHTWHVSAGQVGGYLTQYDGLNFTLVRGAGHMVPQDKPEAAYTMFVNFLNGASPN